MMTKQIVRRSKLRHNLFVSLQIGVIAFFIIPPFIITSNGNNMVRFSFEKVELYLFNRVVGFDNFFTISVGILLLTFLFILFTQLFGRLWCGWLCPQSVFLNIINKISVKMNRRYRLALDIILSIFFALFFSMILLFYFISPYEFLCTLSGRYSHIILTALIVMFLFFFIDFWLVKYRWCKFICPYAKLQAIMNDNDTLYIGMLKSADDRCIKCNSCVRVCPVEIDPRRTPSSECIYCEACIYACEKILNKRGNSGILGYNFGKNFKFTPFRTNVVITAIISFMLLIYILYLIFFNQPFNVDFNLSELTEKAGSKVTFEIKNNRNSPILINIKSEGEVIEKDIILRAKERKEVVISVYKNGAEKKHKVGFRLEESNGYSKEIFTEIK